MVKLLAALLLAGCYAEHEAEPCECEAGQCDGARTYGESQESEEAGSNPATGHQPTYPGPCPFKYDAVHCWCTDATHEVCDGLYCEGPYVGCIAPGSPVSSTWGQR